MRSMGIVTSQCAFLGLGRHHIRAQWVPQSDVGYWLIFGDIWCIADALIQMAIYS